MEYSWDVRTLSLRTQSTSHSGVQDFSTALKESALKYLLDTVESMATCTQTHVYIFSHTLNTYAHTHHSILKNLPLYPEN